MIDTFKLIALGLTAVAAAIAANYGRDLAYTVNMVEVMLFAGIFFVLTLRRVGEPRPAAAALEAEYMDGPIRAGVIATVFWAVVGFLVGVTAAFQLAFPALNLSDLTGGFTNFGKLRPLHTSAVIFAFGGNALIATSFYVVQRTSSARLWGGNAAWFVFWGYNVFIVLAATGYILGATHSKEYAEPEWYMDWWLTVVWVTYLLVFLGTIMKRREPHIYVANWFYLSFIVTIAMLHIVNNLAVPVSLFGSKSVQLFGGVQDAMTQWWYGHNAVGFFLTAAFLGMMYYFVPKQAGRPVYSYRLSIIHFWALIFLYMWAGGHHLHWTSLPDWVSTLAATFSIILLMPSWGGMINGIMTLSGAWDKLRSDPIMMFLIVSLSFYGMSTFEGPLMSLKSVNALSHYTDWTVGHVHSGALGWVAMVSFGSMYHLIPRLWDTKMYSEKLIYIHFWLATIGIVLYITSLWVAGIGQGLMLRSFDDYGNLAYTFIETVEFMHTPYVWRALGGAFFVAGVLVMVYNMAMTLRTAGSRQPVVDEEARLAAALAKN